MFSIILINIYKKLIKYSWEIKISYHIYIVKNEKKKKHLCVYYLSERMF